MRAEYWIDDYKAIKSHGGKHLRPRTKLVSCIFAVISFLYFLIFIPMLLSGRLRLGEYPWALAGVLQWLFWFGLLAGKVWAWRVLTAVYAIECVYGCVNLLILNHSHSTLISVVLVFLLQYILPLGLLLTDTPRRWFCSVKNE